MECSYGIIRLVNLAWERSRGKIHWVPFAWARSFVNANLEDFRSGVCACKLSRLCVRLGTFAQKLSPEELHVKSFAYDF